MTATLHLGMWACFVSMVQDDGDGVIVWNIFPSQGLGPIVHNVHCLTVTADLSTVADDIHPFMTKVYPSPDEDTVSSRISHHVTKLKSLQTDS